MYRRSLGMNVPNSGSTSLGTAALRGIADVGVQQAVGIVRRALGAVLLPKPAPLSQTQRDDYLVLLC
jgi:hypothetical protein